MIGVAAVALGGCIVENGPSSTRANITVAMSLTSPSVVGSGEEVDVHLELTETNGRATPSYSISVYLSTNSIITHGADTELAYVLVPGLSALATNISNLTVTIPSGMPAGGYYLGVIADVDSDVSEANEGDNTNAVPITVTNSGGACSQTHEPDNTISQGKSRGEFVEQTSFFGCCAANDDDNLWIIVDPGFERVLISLYFTHFEGDLELELVNSGGTVIASSTSGTDNEFLNVVVPFAGEYYVRVTYFGASGFNDYEVTWDDVSP
jgi:hypothetical protein